MATKILVTHSGKFHADDVFATATLLKIFPGSTVIRSREPEQIARGDIVYDVGQQYDPSVNRYDHHQREGAGVRGSGVPYAAFGLIWKHFGNQLCSSETVWHVVDERLVERVDANDTGYASLASYTVPTLENYTLDTIAGAFNPTWTESYEKSFDYFMEYVAFATRVLEREIVRAEAYVLGRENVERAYQRADNKKIIVLDKGYPWKEVLIAHPEPLFVIFPEIDSNRYMIQAVHVGPAGYETRASFPEAWRGLTGDVLSAQTGVPGSRFCHSAGFLAVHETLDGAQQLAQQALINHQTVNLGTSQ